MSNSEILLIYKDMKGKIAQDVLGITPPRDIMNVLWIIQTIIFIGKMQSIHMLEI